MTKLSSKIFKSYRDVHGKFLDVASAERQAWFNQLCEHNYVPLLPLPGARILEIGSGGGEILHWLRRNGHPTAVGVDLSPADVAAANDYVGGNVECADAKSFLRNHVGHYDCIIGKDIIEHVKKDDLDDFLSAMHDALATGGRVILQVPNMDWIMAQHERYMDMTHEVGFTKESLGQLLRLFFNDVAVMPVQYDIIGSWRSWIKLMVLRPLAIGITRFWLNLLGAYAGHCWFEHREIIATGIKK